MEHRISELEDQLLEKNIIFQGLIEDEFDDISDTKSKIISVLSTVCDGETAKDKKESAKKHQLTLLRGWVNSTSTYLDQ